MTATQDLTPAQQGRQIALTRLALILTPVAKEAQESITRCEEAKAEDQIEFCRAHLAVFAGIVTLAREAQERIVTRSDWLRAMGEE